MTAQFKKNGDIFDRIVKNVTSILQLGQRGDEGMSSDLSCDTNIFDDLGIDSVELMDLLGLLEREFKTTFNIDKFGHRKTLGDIVDFIETELSEEKK